MGELCDSFLRKPYWLRFIDIFPLFRTYINRVVSVSLSLSFSVLLLLSLIHAAQLTRRALRAFPLIIHAGTHLRLRVFHSRDGFTDSLSMQRIHAH